MTALSFWRIWLNSRKLQRPRGRRDARPANPRPHIEELENRELPSATALGADQLRGAYGQIPLSFEANQGQTDAQVRFLSRGQGYGLYLTADEAILSLLKPAPATADQRPAAPASAGDVLRLQMVGGNPTASVIGMDEMSSKSNYLIGNDSSRWQTNVANYGKVAYHGVYPGIDLVYYGNQRQLEYDFIVAPGADPGAITLGFGGGQGMSLDAAGNLVLHTSGGDVVEHAPVLYQETPAGRQPVTGRYVFRGPDHVGFQVDAYDRRLPLVIDPVLSYSTYLAGTRDTPLAIAVDASGNAYITGYTYSTNFLTRNPYQGTFGGGIMDAFVTKLNATGTDVIFSTFLGGSDQERGTGIAVDTTGNIVITGWTMSRNFPTRNAFQSSLPGDPTIQDQAAFVTKLNAAGTDIVYSTYLGNTDGGTGATGVALDSSGNAYVTGRTGQGFPTRNAYQTSLPTAGGVGHSFVTKFDGNGGVIYSTYLGGSGDDFAQAIAVDAAGEACITGQTKSADFPMLNPFQSTNAGGTYDDFLTKLNASGNGLIFSTYLGGNDADYSNAIAIDRSGNIYIAGQTVSNNFPVQNAFQSVRGAFSDATVAKFDANGALVYSTYLGGSATDYATGIAVDSLGEAYVTGVTSSSDFPTRNSLQGSNETDAFITKLTASGSALVYSTYLGGPGSDLAYGIALDATGNAYVVGNTYSTSFPVTPGALLTSWNGSSVYTGFATKISDQVMTAVAVSAVTGTYGGTVTLTAALNAGGTPISGRTVSFTLNGTAVGTATTDASGTAALANVSLTGINAGTYATAVGAQFAGDSAFSASSGTGALTVNKATLQLTADSKSKHYGDPIPTLTYVLSGFVNGENATSAGITGTPGLNTTATVSGSVAGGPYPIVVTAGTLSAANYTFMPINGSLTVTPTALMVSADNQSKTYGQANPAFTASYSGFVLGESPAVLGGTLTFATSAATTSHAGAYPITPSGLTSTNYTVTFVAGTLTITPAPLLITADSKSKVYGAALPTLTASYSGFVNGDGPASLTTPVSLATTATAASPAGTYPIAASGASSADYAITFAAGTLTVTPAALTVTAANVSRLYGAANPAFTVSYSGFANGDTAASLGGSLTFSTPATASSPVGSYPVTPAGLTSSNYAITFAAGTLTITPVALTITANNTSKVYGQLNPALTASYSGFVNGDSAASLGGTLAFSTSASASSPVGSYAVTPSGLTAANYTITFVSGTLTITPAALTVTANNAAKTYGQANPAFTVSYSGFVNGDSAAGLAGMLSFNTAATVGSSVGSYVVTPAGLTSSNYTITFAAGTLTITPAPLTVTANNAVKVYGQANPAFTAGFSGFVNGDTAASLSGSLTFTTAATTASHVGTYPVTPGGLTAANYAITFAAGTLTITPAALTISADAQTKIYGQANPPLTASYSGFVNGDSAANLATPVSLATSATAAGPAGSYAITASGATSADYTITFAAGTLTVTPAPLTVTAASAIKLYGDPVPTFSASYSGFVNGDGPGVLGGTLAFSTAATMTSPVGTYAVTPSGLTAANYALTFATGTLAISPAPLAVSATDQTKQYGAALPAFTVTYTGFVLGENAGVLGGSLILSTPATAASPAGTYAITPAGLTAANYAIVFVNGTLTVNPAPLTVTANNQAKVYGQANPAFTVSYSGFVNGDAAANLSGSLTFTTPATVASPVGSYAVTPGGLTSSNYTITFTAGTLSVTPAALTVTANNTTRLYGQANPTFTASYNGLVNGDTPASLGGSLLFSTPANPLSPVGTYSIALAGQTSNNYTITFVSGTLTVAPAPLAVTAGNVTRSYAQANPTFTVRYSGFVNGDTPASLGGTLSITTPATVSSPAGTYPITPAGLTATNYAITFVKGTLTITPLTLTVTGRAFRATAGAPFKGTVATFRNPDPYGGTASYRATIDWGDGTTSTGTITTNAQGGFNVDGAHTYAAARTDTVRVQIVHVLGNTTPGTATSTATVASLNQGVTRGLTGTVAFWSGTSGQALIKRFNGGSTAMALANWLAATFPNLYGTGAGTHNLTGKTNAQVAAFFLSLAQLPLPRIDADVLATALSVYATTRSLGGTVASTYGFTVSATGLGAHNYNVGANGAAFGVANNTLLNVYALLQAANRQAVNGVLFGGNATLRQEADNVFAGLLQAGHV